MIYEEREGRVDPGTASNTGEFSPQGYNVRNVEVKLLREPFAQASIDVYDYETNVAQSILRTFEKVDGQWYSETLPC